MESLSELPLFRLDLLFDAEEEVIKSMIPEALIVYVKRQRYKCTIMHDFLLESDQYKAPKLVFCLKKMPEGKRWRLITECRLDIRPIIEI